MPQIDKVRELAVNLAIKQAENNATISKILWFPNADTIRLVIMDTESFPEDREVVPYYFGATNETVLPCGLAVILPSEEGRLELPADWNAAWHDAEVIFERQPIPAH